MSVISHRELRNNSSNVLRAVAAGESFTVTNNGSAVARIVPVNEGQVPELPLIRAATGHGDLSSMTRRRRDVTVADILDELRAER